MKFRWQLAIYDEPGEIISSLEGIIHLGKDIAIQQSFDLESCSIFLESEGKEWLGLNWNFGSLDLIVFQSEAAWNRLTMGEDAIIRSGILGGESVPYLLLEPWSDDKVFVSLFFITEAHIGATFPIDGISGFSKDLYNHLLSHKEKILLHSSEFKRLACPGTELLESLKREASLGRQLYQAVGMSLGGLLDQYSTAIDLP
jgi:hypothetical protein